MHWIDESSGLVCGFAGIYQTTDGGQSWAEVLDGPCSTMSFSDGLTGTAGMNFDAGLWVTEDGGTTWTYIDSPWTLSTQVVAATDDGFLLGSAGSVIQRLVPTGLLFADGFESGDTPALSYWNFGAGLVWR